MVKRGDIYKIEEGYTIYVLVLKVAPNAITPMVVKAKDSAFNEILEYGNYDLDTLSVFEPDMVMSETDIIKIEERLNMR